jgi:hypothetical protein
VLYKEKNFKDRGNFKNKKTIRIQGLKKKSRFLKNLLKKKGCISPHFGERCNEKF